VPCRLHPKIFVDLTLSDDDSPSTILHPSVRVLVRGICVLLIAPVLLLQRPVKKEEENGKKRKEKDELEPFEKEYVDNNHLTTDNEQLNR
jgi:hypothetical protein